MGRVYRADARGHQVDMRGRAVANLGETVLRRSVRVGRPVNLGEEHFLRAGVDAVLVVGLPRVAHALVDDEFLAGLGVLGDGNHL